MLVTICSHLRPRLRNLLLAATATLFCLSLAASSQAAAVSSRMPFTFDLVNPCTGEVVLLDGTIHLVSRGGEPPFEGPHGFHFSVQAQGVSDAGARYVLVDVQNVQTTFPEGEPGEDPPADRPAADTSTEIVRIQLIRQGNGPLEDDQTFFVTAHITVNPQGDITALKLEFEEDCR
jgi:hypothetical protein